MRPWRRLLAALGITALGLAGYLSGTGHVDTGTRPEPLLAQSSEAFMD